MRLLKTAEMRKILIYLILLLIFSTSAGLNSYGQDSDISLIIENLFVRIQRSSDDREKIRLNDSIDLFINRYANSDSALIRNIPNVRNLGQLTSSDSKIKILTWNLILRNGSNRYFLYLIKKNQKKETGNKVYVLKGEFKANAPDTMKIYNESNWYGALYYAIQPFRHNDKTAYLLLGIDFSTDQVNRKIIDILTFDNNDRPVFGKEYFYRDGKAKFRHVIEYSADGIISLRIDSHKLVVFDHTEPYSSGHEGLSDNMGAGLSFDGYKLKKGKWEFVKNLDIRNRKK